jgi:Mrp family chromosome partitioning ATPase
MKRSISILASVAVMSTTQAVKYEKFLAQLDNVIDQTTLSQIEIQERSQQPMIFAEVEESSAFPEMFVEVGSEADRQRVNAQ